MLFRSNASYRVRGIQVSDCLSAVVKRINGIFYKGRRDSSEQSGNAVGADTVESAKYLLRFFRREITLYIGYHKNQKNEQHHDLYRIIDEELQTAAQLAFSIKTAGVQQRADKPVQPFHAEYFVLYEVPHYSSSPPSISVSISAFIGRNIAAEYLTAYI